MHLKRMCPFEKCEKNQTSSNRVRDGGRTFILRQPLRFNIGIVTCTAVSRTEQNTDIITRKAVDNPIFRSGIESFYLYTCSHEGISLVI